MAELAAEVSRQTGKQVVYNDMPAEQYRDLLTGAGLPAAVAEMLADADLGLSRGELDHETGDLGRLIGRPSTPLSDAVRAAVQ